MRKGTLITGVILVVIATAVVGYHLWDMERTETAEIHHYADVHFDSYLGSMSVYASWSNNSSTSAGAESFAFYVVVNEPDSCNNITGIVAQGSGSNGSLVAQFHGPHDWYAVLCDSSGDRAGFLFTYHQFAPTYYLVAGSGIGVLGAGLILLAYLQPPAPPLGLKNRGLHEAGGRVPPPEPPAAGEAMPTPGPTTSDPGPGPSGPDGDP
jgi:hypothetical protein